MAIRNRAYRDFGTDNCSGAAAVVDDDILAKPLAETRRDDAPDNVDGAARRKGHDHAHRLSWIRGLQKRPPRQRASGDNAKHFSRIFFHRFKPTSQPALEI